ncbi:MAG: CusA/CzcA family heavy metal efflux RND transporter [Arcicella sp.]|nr:CusA/CzcA family heavy metal efflux RND transporter [Arcicella sp.]
MIDKIIRFSIYNRLIIIALILGLVAWGSYSLTQLNVDALPDITSNQVQILTNSPALPATEVEKFITYPLEMSLRTVPNTKEIRSFSRMGLSVITVVFEDDIPMETARQQVSEKLRGAEPNLMAGAGRPEMAPITTGLGEFYQYTLTVAEPQKSKYSLTDLRTMQDWIVKRQLLGIKGVVEISSFGGKLKQYEVAINPERLRSMNLSISEVFKVLQESNSNSGGGYIEKGTDAYFIRSEGMIKNLEDIENVVVTNRGSVPVLVRDVATVQFGHAVRYGAMTRNGEGEIVGGVVLLLKGESAQKVVIEVKKRIEEIQKSLPEGVKLTAFIDRSKLIDRAMGTVKRNLVEGGLIVVFILVLLLGNWRAGLIVASVIPLCLLFSFSMMQLFGVSANLMSLGAIDFGLIVDGAVIIVEAVIFQLATALQPPKGELKSDSETPLLGAGGLDIVYQATVTIRKSAAFGEIIILIVYLPILALSGIEGKMFRPMAQTVGFAIFAALILSLTYVPMMSAWILTKNISHKENIADKIIGFLYRIYDKSLRRILKINSWVTIGISVLVFVGSLLIFKTLGGEFIPELNEGDFAVEMVLHSNASLSQSVKMNNEAQKILLREFPDEVSQVVSRIGASEIPTDPMGLNSCDLIIDLKDSESWKKAETMEELSEKMREKLQQLPGIGFEFTQPIQMRFNELIAGVKSDVAIKIYGEDLDILYEKAQEVAHKIRKIEGIGSLKVQQIEGVPQMVVAYNRQKIAQYGLKINDLNVLLKAAFAGEQAGVVYEGEKRFDLVIRLDSAYRKDIQQVRDLYLDLPNGGKVPFAEVADIDYQDAPSEIARDNTRRRISIGINVQNRDVESLVTDIQEVINQKVKIPVGYSIEYGGAFENLEAAKSRLSLVVPLSLILIFILLFFTFNSFSEALMVFIAIPLSAIGGILALWLRDMPFSVSAGIGFIALFGVAVLNGIVLISQFNLLENQGFINIKQRIMEGTKTRFRPVIMTAAVASLGFLPMALSSSPGAEVQRPLATVVIGGLITATLLTLIVLPVIYLVFKGRKGEEGKEGRQGEKSLMVASFIFGIFFLGNDVKAQIPNSLTRSVSRPNPSPVERGGSVHENSPLHRRGVGATDASGEVVSLEMCIEKAIQNNQNIKISALEISNNQALIGTARELPKTNIDVQYGRTQVYTGNDVTFSFGQNFALPSLYRANQNLLKNNVLTAEKRANYTKNQLVAEVKNVYYQWLYNVQLIRLLKQQDSLYTMAFRAASVRYKTGESNLLEKISSETRLREIQNQIQMHEADKKVLIEQMKFLLNTTENIILEENIFNKKQMIINELNVLANPFLDILKQQNEVSKLQISLEKERLKPDFRVGIINQSIEQNYNQNVVQLGVNVPIFRKAQQSRISSAKINEQISNQQVQLAQNQLESQLNSLKIQYEKRKNSLDYYEKSALPQADLIIKTATKSYQSGEIEYVEFAQNITQAWQIKELYLSELQGFNQIIINIETIIGNE